MNSELWSYVGSGAVLGFWAGVAPGPLLTLVITETLRYGHRAGARVALSPLITDFPIIALTLYALSTLASVSGALGVVSFAGAVLLLWMAWETFTAKPFKVKGSTAKAHSLRKGVLTNFLNPHPYLFWLTVGGPLLYSANDAVGLVGPALFLALFYVMIVMSKLAVAYLTAKSRSFLSGPLYTWLLRLLSAALVFFAFLFIRDGWTIIVS